MIVFRKTNRSARKSIIPYTRKYAFEHEDANVNKETEACFTHRRSVGLASSLDGEVKGNKAIKQKYVFLANRLVFPNTVTYQQCTFINGLFTPQKNHMNLWSLDNQSNWTTGN